MPRRSPKKRVWKSRIVKVDASNIIERLWKGRTPNGFSLWKPPLPPVPLFCANNQEEENDAQNDQPVFQGDENDAQNDPHKLQVDGNDAENGHQENEDLVEESTVMPQVFQDCEDEPMLASLNSTDSDFHNMDLDYCGDDLDDTEAREEARQKILNKVFGKWNRRVTDHTKITVVELVTEILKAMAKWNVSNECQSHILRLIEKIVKPDVDFPTSLDVVKSVLQKKNILTDPETLCACPICGNFVTEENIDGRKCYACAYCENLDNGPKIYPKCLNFSYNPITPSLKLGLESGLYKDVSHFLHLRKQDGSRRTFLDGEVCVELVEEFGENVLFISLNSDSGKSAKSSNASKWLLQHCVLQPGQLKPQPRMNTLFYRGPAQSKLMEKGWPSKFYDTLYEKLIDELIILATTGISFTVDNIVKNVKVFVLTHNMDSVERYPVLGIRHFTANFGCCLCLYNPEVSPIYKYRYYVSDGTGKRMSPRDPEYMKRLALDAEEFYRRPEKLQTKEEELKLKGVVRRPVMHRLSYFSPFRQTCMDLQHQVCLGTGYEFITNLLKHLSSSDEALLDEFFSKQQIPTVFQRNPRSFSEIGKFKANELYTVTNFTGVPGLHAAGVHAYYAEEPSKNLEKRKRYHLFARFAAIIQVVISKNYNVEMEEIIAKDLVELSDDCQEQLGVKFMKYNFHQIVHHLLDGIYEIGPMHVTSCFIHEGLMGTARRMQHQFFKVGTEISNRLALQQASDFLEESVVKPSNSDDIQELRFARRTKLHESAHRLTRNGRKVYLLDKGTDLQTYYGKISGYEKLLLEAAIFDELGEGWNERVEITVFDAAISQFDFRIERRQDTQRSAEKKRSDCCVQLSNGKATFVIGILCIKDGTKETAFIYGTKVTEKNWNYFDLNDILKRDIYKKFYRLITEEPCERILTDIFNVEMPVMVFKDTYQGMVIAPVYLPVPS